MSLERRYAQVAKQIDEQFGDHVEAGGIECGPDLNNGVPRANWKEGTSQSVRDQFDAMVAALDLRPRKTRPLAHIRQEVLAFLTTPTLPSLLWAQRVNRLLALVAAVAIQQRPDLGGGDLPEGDEPAEDTPNLNDPPNREERR